jgi:hypothetical protein
MRDIRCIKTIFVIAYYMVNVGDTFNAGVNDDVTAHQFSNKFIFFQRLSTVFIDQMPTYIVLKIVHCELATKFSTLYHVA